MLYGEVSTQAQQPCNPLLILVASDSRFDGNYVPWPTFDRSCDSGLSIDLSVCWVQYRGRERTFERRSLDHPLARFHIVRSVSTFLKHNPTDSLHELEPGRVGAVFERAPSDCRRARFRVVRG
jgi:hypothetical protein